MLPLIHSKKCGSGLKCLETILGNELSFRKLIVYKLRTQAFHAVIQVDYFCHILQNIRTCPPQAPINSPPSNSPR